jgi:murein DD-endopeptidase MepM/ murein hydrolase activator NlpD
MASARARVFLALVIGIVLLVAIVAYLQRRSGHYVSQVSEATPSPTPVSPTPIASQSTEPLPTASAETPVPSPITEPSAGSPTPALSVPDLVPAAPPVGFVGTLKLIVPVAGVQPNQLLDTFSDSRSEGRVHDAIDISAAAGTPVLAAAEGQIIKLFQSERGGTTIYQLSTNQKLIFYYAHLQGYADGLTEGKSVRQGEVIGYVGDTGNAGPGNYHLHFSIAVVTDPKRYWEGTNINPYPLLRNE